MHFILASDVETMPTTNGVVSTTNLVLKANKKAVSVYLTPKSINRFDASEGETSNEMGGWLSNFTGTRPGDDEFFAAWLQEHLNEGFLIISEECGDNKGTRLQGTPCNPLYMSVEAQDNEEGIMSNLTFVSSQRSANKMIHYRGTLPTAYDPASVVEGSAGGGI
ncbi:hypothetical protein C943_03289 [Mariniradius saccharolyticus AK6]|uniref:Uncharacterized protein n=1 Tax=Mariniradius saccharolyticus AK6 TaxID=1239962 RepID=M7Y1I4_9BACT|nr:hypothetical protein C943_03289 [Mariniradius saccharolyticus AK6]